MSNSSIRPIRRTISGATTSGLSELESNSNEGVLRIPPSFSITGILPSECLVPYPGHSLGWGGGLPPLQRCSQCILQPQLIYIYIYITVRSSFVEQIYFVSPVALRSSLNWESISFRFRLHCMFISAAFKSHTKWEMYHMSANQLSPYNWLQQVPITVCTASFTRYTRHKQALTKILQNIYIYENKM